MADIHPCEREGCGQPHVTLKGNQACAGHISGKTRPERKGQPCHADPMHGQRVCGAHGGRKRNAKAAGQARVAEEDARKLAAKWSVPIDTTPTEAILGRIRAFAGHVAFYQAQIDMLADEDFVWGKTKEVAGQAVVGDGRNARLENTTDSTFEAGTNTWVALYNEASRDLVKFAGEALRIGIEERRVRLAEQQGALVADVIKAILTDLKLTPAQAAKVKDIVPAHLRRLSAVA